ncbi:MAG TPA: G1 family glutamic endopeptidase [Solirubrobacteraceae bacterium]
MSLRRPLSRIALAAVALLALPAAPAGAATVEATSSNWAGYAVARKGTRFKRVSGSWVQPAVDCTGDRSYSAYWVGLGGYRTTSNALEQVGTAADCDSTGAAHYTAWYELVPAAAVTMKLGVRAPSLCDGRGFCATQPLADFGTARFTAARAVTTGGHAGAIRDPAWSAIAISLLGATDGDPRFARDTLATGAATPGTLSTAGDAFSVSFDATSAAGSPA